MKCKKNNSPLACLAFSHGLGAILMLISDCRRRCSEDVDAGDLKQILGAGMVLASSPQPMRARLVARSTSHPTNQKSVFPPSLIRHLRPPVWGRTGGV